MRYFLNRSLSVCCLFFLMIAFAISSVEACNQGDKLEVLWKGSWYPATALHGNGDRCFIHYDGYESSWDEWVGSDRMRQKGAKKNTSKPAPAQVTFSEGDPVQVLWKGTWYDAHVLKTKGTQAFIHYNGYESSWDEWVGPDRIKPKAGATSSSAPPPTAPTTTTSTSSFNASAYSCAQFLTDYQSKNSNAMQAIEYAIAYFGKRSGKSMAGMDSNARMGFEMAFGMECPEAPQTTWEDMVKKIYESSDNK